MPKNHVFSLYGEVAFTTSGTRGMRHRVGFWKAPKPLTSLVNRVGITAELPDGRHLWCRSYSDGRSDADHSENSPSATTIHSEADCIRKRSGSGRGRLGPKPNSVLRLCCFVCSFRRRGGLHFPLGDPTRDLRHVRACRDGHLYLHSCARLVLCLAKGCSAVGLRKAV